MVEDFTVDNYVSVPMVGADNFSDSYVDDTSAGKGLSSMTILIIVLVVCGILGIGLGILAGRRSANK